MYKPSVVRIVIKDIVDFILIIAATSMLTFSIYLVVPGFLPVDLSFYFFEQYVELFFVNPKLVVWFLGLGLGVTVIYYLFCAMLFSSTFGGVIARVSVLDRSSLKPWTLLQAVLMAIGAYVGVLAVLVGPLSAWWLDREHRGFAEKVAGTFCVGKTNEPVSRGSAY